MQNLMNCIGILFLLQLCFTDVAGQDAGVLRSVPGLPAMEHIEDLPLLYKDGTETHQFSSYDPSGGNTDGSFMNAYTKYKDKNGEYVIFDASGPGCLYRMQYNVWFMGNYLAANKARIKFYFDDDTAARIDVPANEFFAGKFSPYTIPYAFLDSSLRFGNLYYPFPFKKRLKITTTYTFPPSYPASWYQFTYHTLAKDTALRSWTGPDQGKAYRRVISQWDNRGKDPKLQAGNIKVSKTVSIPAGGAATVAALKGAGSVSGIKIHLDPYDQNTFFHTRILIYWDNARQPAVDMPLASFFGGGGEHYKDCRDIYKKILKTLMYGYNGQKHSFYSYWPMPYWRSARIVLKNNSKTDLDAVQVEITYKPADIYEYSKENSGYFYAKRTISKDTGQALFASVFRETGRGHVVGISFYSADYAMDGDEFTYIDGNRTPQIHGDGTEDDHNQGWGGAAYQEPLWGGLINGFQGAYRLYLNDAYIFNRSISINYGFSMEGGNKYGGEVDATIYYYKSPLPGNLILTDQVDVGDRRSEQAHQYMVSGKRWTKTITSGYDAYERDYEYDIARDNGYAYDGYSEFTVNIDPDNDGVRLRRRIYRSGNGVQRAAVYVDGVKVKERPWDIVTLSSAPYYQGWYDADFEIPASYTRGKHSIQIKIKYLGGGSKPEINEFYYWVFSYSHKVKPAQTTTIKKLQARSAGPFSIDLSWRIKQKLPQNLYYRIYRSTSREFTKPILAGTSNTLAFTDTRVQPGTKYYYRVAAVCAPDKDIFGKRTVRAATKAVSETARAHFVRTDTVTMGSWAGKYGFDGFILPRYFYGHTLQALPDYISTVDYGRMKGHQFSTWNNSTVSSLNPNPINYGKRYLGGVVTKTTDSVEIYVNDKKQHQLALYFCDFDKKDRRQKIEILDMQGKVIAPPVTLNNFEKGRWLLYDYSGSIRIRITNENKQTSAVISALMFDDAGSSVNK